MSRNEARSDGHEVHRPSAVPAVDIQIERVTLSGVGPLDRGLLMRAIESHLHQLIAAQPISMDGNDPLEIPAVDGGQIQPLAGIEPVAESIALSIHRSLTR